MSRRHPTQGCLGSSLGLTTSKNGWCRTPIDCAYYCHQERVSANYVYRLLRLPCLAPEIITAIVNGKNPPQLTAKKLMRLTPQIPVDWAEQRKLLGFHS